MSGRRGVARNDCGVFNLDWKAQAASLHSSAASRRNLFWVAHASRVLVSASRRHSLLLQKVAIAGTQSPTARFEPDWHCVRYPEISCATRRQLRMSVPSIASRYVVAETNRRRFEGCDAGKGCSAPECASLAQSRPQKRDHRKSRRRWRTQRCRCDRGNSQTGKTATGFDRKFCEGRTRRAGGKRESGDGGAESVPPTGNEG